MYFSSINDDFVEGRMDEVTIILRTKDRFVNATRCFEEHEKNFASWYLRFRSLLTKTFDFWTTEYIGSDDDDRIKGIYVHPIIAPFVMTEISIVFAMKVNHLIHSCGLIEQSRSLQ